MKKEELLKIREFTQEEINSKESLIKEKVDDFALSTIDRIDQLEAENKKMRNLLKKAIREERHYVSYGFITTMACNWCGCGLGKYGDENHYEGCIKKEIIDFIYPEEDN